MCYFSAFFDWNYSTYFQYSTKKKKKISQIEFRPALKSGPQPAPIVNNVQVKTGAYSHGLLVNWNKKLWNMFTSHILWLKFITNQDKVITNYDKLLKIATGITNYDSYYKLRQNRRHFAGKLAVAKYGLVCFRPH